jgi:C-5 cytosine-specific DNA methylase
VKPLCIDLFCGLGGWAEGFLAEGYDVVGFDIERHEYGDQKYPAQLVIQDVLTLHGSQFRNAACIVASPPCQAYSYRGMPWRKLWLENARMDDDGAPAGNYLAPDPIDHRLFRACFEIQGEACEASGRYIPLVVENVKSAQTFLGRAAWRYGSFYLWGDVPALMPKAPAFKGFGGSWFAQNHNTNTGGKGNPIDGTGIKQPGLSGPVWFDEGAAKFSSKSPQRKAASAQIAKIPLALSQHIARVYKPNRKDQAA